jgi:hypothetical protein
MSSDTQDGIVYILSNQAMPGLIKIGRTGTGRLRQRVSELFTTGVPLPFNVEFAARVSDAWATERRLHQEFGGQQVAARREWFWLDPERARAALEPDSLEDMTPQLLADNAELPTELIDAAARPGGWRSSMDFFAMGLRPGERLIEIDSGCSAYVEDRRRVYFEGQHGRYLNDIYRDLHETRRKNRWRTEDGYRVWDLFYQVQHGDSPPPWPERRQASAETGA